MVSSPGRRASYVRCFVCADDAPVTMTTVRTASVKAVMSRIGPRACRLPTDTTVTYRVRGYGDYPYGVRRSAQPLQMSCCHHNVNIPAYHFARRGEPREQASERLAEVLDYPSLDLGQLYLMSQLALQAGHAELADTARVMRSNQVRSVETFRAKPWEVIQPEENLTPMAAIFFSPTRTPVYSGWCHPSSP